MDYRVVLDIYVPIVSAIFLTAFAIYMVRAAKGPTVPDMVLAVDCLTFDLAVFLALLSLYYETPFLVVGALLLALWAFLFDLFVAKYMLKKLR